jgi:hypothetical protein
MKTRRIVTSSICAIMESSARKQRNASFTNLILRVTSGGFDDVYLLDGRTNRGRKLRLIFQDKGNGLARVITGWDLSPDKKKR